MRRHGSSISVMTMLWAGQPRNWGLILSRRKRYLFPTVHTGSGAHTINHSSSGIPGKAEKWSRYEAHCSSI
jgi:hypothetical protein